MIIHYDGRTYYCLNTYMKMRMHYTVRSKFETMPYMLDEIVRFRLWEVFFNLELADSNIELRLGV